MAATKKTQPVELLNDLEPMLTRLKLTAIRDQLDTLLDQAGRAEMNLREALAMLCAAEVARKDERRIQMGMSIAKFPCVRTLESFEYDAQPSVDPKQIRELATSRWVANGDSVLLLGPPGVGSLSESLCARHSMTTRSMNATQDQARHGGPSGAAADSG